MIINLAEYIIYICNKNSYPVTNTKLQKLLFYSYLESGKRLFSDNIKKSENGITIDKVNNKYKKYKYQNINLGYTNKDIPQETKDILNKTINKYGHFDGKFLEELVKQEIIVSNKDIGDKIN